MKLGRKTINPIAPTMPNHWQSKKTSRAALRRASVISDPKLDAMPSETNDCCVRAFSHATRLDYKTAHAFIKALGRKNGQGFWMEEIMKAVRCEDISCRFKSERKTAQTRHALPGYDTEPDFSGVKLSTALPYLKFGRYILTIASHTFAVINGKVMDSGINSDSHVRLVYKLEE